MVSNSDSIDKNLFSFGGGVQSTACLVLAAQGKIPYRDFAFANVGEKAEHPSVLEYMENVSAPFAKKHGLNIFVLRKTDKDGNPVDLYDYIHKRTGALVIPVRLSGGKPAKRDCTNDFKIKVLDKFVKSNGYTGLRGMGTSTDEVHRCRTGFDYPLIDLNLDRYDCQRIIESAGLPPAPKSACWFCPYSSMNRWQTLQKENPKLFQKAVDMEKMLSDRYEGKGKGKTWITGKGQTRSARLDQLMSDQMEIEGLDLNNCDSGHCWT